MTYPVLRSLIASGDLVLWLDLRSGHSGNLVGYGGVGDASINGAGKGVLRTGVGFETSAQQDFEGVADPTSQGYLKVAHHSDLVPPAGGCCVLASYVMSYDEQPRSHIIGLGEYGTPAAACWELLRDNRALMFATSDGVNEADFQYLVSVVLGEVETVAARYTGGTGPDNCTLKLYAPAASSAVGTIDVVPADVDTNLQLCAASGGELQPFMGTLRWAAFVRGAQTQDIVDALVAEIESFRWNTQISCKDRDGGIATRRLHYEGRFGADVWQFGEDVGGAQISNSDWHLVPVLDTGGDYTGSAKVDFVHMQGVADWALSDIHKALVDNYKLGMGNITVCALATADMACTEAEAAYGTWDWWMYPVSEVGQHVSLWPVASEAGLVAGYEVRIAANGALSLQEWAAGVPTQLATTAANVIPQSAWVHLRVTRTDAGVFKVFYDIGAGWVLAFTVTDVTVTSSKCMLFGTCTDTHGSMLCLGNNHGERGPFKWHGVVLPV